MYERGKNKTHEYENSVCITLPLFNYFCVPFLGLSEVYGPQPVRRICVLFVWYRGEITNYETVRRTYPASPVNYQILAREGSLCDFDGHPWPEAGGPR